jgi:hypothetical protein
VSLRRSWNARTRWAKGSGPGLGGLEEMTSQQGHHIGPLDEPEAKFHGFQEFLAGRSRRAVVRAACFLATFFGTSLAIFSVESGCAFEPIVEGSRLGRTGDSGFGRVSGATNDASEYCSMVEATL